MQRDSEASNALALEALRRGEEYFAASPYWQTHGSPTVVSVDLYSDRGLTLQRVDGGGSGSGGGADKTAVLVVAVVLSVVAVLTLPLTPTLTPTLTLTLTPILALTLTPILALF